MRIDIHTHYYPGDYLKIMERSGRAEIREDSDGRKAIHQGNARVVTLTPAMHDMDVRLADMERDGVDIAVLSISIPNVYFADESEAVEVSRASNEGLMEMVRRYPSKLSALGCVPLQVPDKAPAELDVALKAGMRGISIGTNIGGRMLTDPVFAPFFEACNEQHAVVMLHPMAPLGIDAMKSYALAPMVGFISDTTLAVAAMIYDGFPERYPNIRFVLPHLGGALPYLAGRLDNGYGAYVECRKNLSAPPSVHLRRFYYDTVSFHEPALRCALQTAGYTQIVYGSDYPHVIGDMRRTIASVQQLELPQEQEDSILGGNAKTLLGL